MLPITGKRNIKENEKHFLLDEDLLPINGKRNVKENEKPFPFGLRLASNEWPKELKEER